MSEKYLKIELPEKFDGNDNLFIDLITNKTLIKVSEVPDKDFNKVYIDDCKHYKRIDRKPTKEEIESGGWDEDEIIQESYLDYGGLFEYKNGFQNFMCPICNSKYYKELDINTKEISFSDLEKFGDPIYSAYYGKIDDYNPDPYDDYTYEFVCCTDLKDRETDTYKVFWNQFYGQNNSIEIRYSKNMDIEKIYYYDNFIVLKYYENRKKFNEFTFEEKMNYISNLLEKNYRCYMIQNIDSKYLDVNGSICIINNYETDSLYYIYHVRNNKIIKNDKKIVDVELNVEDGFILAFIFTLDGGEKYSCSLVDIDKKIKSISYKPF